MKIGNKGMRYQQDPKPQEHPVQAEHIASHDVDIYGKLDQERTNSTQNRRSNRKENDEIKNTDIRLYENKEPFQDLAIECFAGFSTAGLFHGEFYAANFYACKDT